MREYGFSLTLTQENTGQSKSVFSYISSVYRFISVFVKQSVMDLSTEMLNPLSANPTKWSNTLKQSVGKYPTNCMSVFNNFVGLELKGLKAKFR